MTTKRSLLYTALVLLALAVLSMDARADEPKPVVNINTATATELAYLPGIGPTLAARIVEWRTARFAADSRPLVACQQLAAVKGIGRAKIERILPYVVFSGPTTATTKIKKEGVK